MHTEQFIVENGRSTKYKIVLLFISNQTVLLDCGMKLSEIKIAAAARILSPTIAKKAPHIIERITVSDGSSNNNENNIISN